MGVAAQVEHAGNTSGGLHVDVELDAASLVDLAVQIDRPAEHCRGALGDETSGERVADLGAEHLVEAGNELVAGTDREPIW